MVTTVEGAQATNAPPEENAEPEGTADDTDDDKDDENEDDEIMSREVSTADDGITESVFSFGGARRSFFPHVHCNIADGSRRGGKRFVCLQLGHKITLVDVTEGDGTEPAGGGTAVGFCSVGTL